MKTLEIDLETRSDRDITKCGVYAYVDSPYFAITLMGTSDKSFGELLTQLREKKDKTLRELARAIGVSAPFLSDVEKGRRSALTAERIDKVAEVLQLDQDERNALFDAAGKQKNSIPPDLPDYIMEHEFVSAALRTARDLDASEEEWKRFVEDLRRRKE